MDSLIVSNVPDYQALLESVFGAFLSEKKVSEKTRKNYQSDVRRFMGHIVEKNQSLLKAPSRSWRNQEDLLKSILGTINAETIEGYKQELFTANTPSSTINRHLSALRLFFRCAIERRWISRNPAELTKNISSVTNLLTNQSVLLAFEKFLTEDGASKTTVRNYLSDVTEFLDWIDNQSEKIITDL